MHPRRRISGFTLIEIVVVIAVLGILIAMAAALTRGLVAGQKRALTVTRLATVDAALVQYVTQQRRVPCPADGTLPSNDANAGMETARTDAAGCTTTQQNGVVPWRAIGLAEPDATDGWDRRLTYRTDPALAKLDGMNMAWCDPGGTGPAVGGACRSDGACMSTALGSCTQPTNFLVNKGLQVRRADGVTVLMDPTLTTPHTGAAYVVISHGESGGGGYLTSGVLGSSLIGDGTQEMKNYASAPYAAATTYYVDDSLAEAAGTAHYDDLVSRPTLLSLITKAGLGPRAH